jgi:hypothetical protein
MLWAVPWFLGLGLIGAAILVVGVTGRKDIGNAVFKPAAALILGGLPLILVHVLVATRRPVAGPIPRRQPALRTL